MGFCLRPRISTDPGHRRRPARETAPRLGLLAVSTAPSQPVPFSHRRGPFVETTGVSNGLRPNARPEVFAGAVHRPRDCVSWRPSVRAQREGVAAFSHRRGWRSLIEFRPVPTGRLLRTRLVRSLPLIPVVLAAMQGVARAAEVVITPAASASPAEDFGGWTFKMALASISLTVVVAALLASAYVRLAPRFFLGEQTGGAPPIRPQPRPGAAAATVALDAPPLPRPAPVQAPAQAAPEPAASAAAVEPASEAAPAPAAGAGEAPPAAPSPAPVPRAEPAPREEGPLELDQETLDRVLQEELAKGTDRRVAEGRAKGAAARAARRKAQG